MRRRQELKAAVERAQWLAELATCVAQAQRVCRELADDRSDAELAALQRQLNRIRSEIESLRRGGWPTR